MSGQVPGWTEFLIGPVGGLLGLAFGAGAAAGWQFAQRTVLSMLKKQMEVCEAALAEERLGRRLEKAECDQRIQLLENKLRDVEDRQIAGMRGHIEGLQKQLRQVRRSTANLLADGKIRGVKDIQ